MAITILTMPQKCQKNNNDRRMRIRTIAEKNAVVYSLALLDKHARCVTQGILQQYIHTLIYTVYL